MLERKDERVDPRKEGRARAQNNNRQAHRWPLTGTPHDRAQPQTSSDSDSGELPFPDGINGIFLRNSNVFRTLRLCIRNSYGGDNEAETIQTLRRPGPLIPRIDITRVVETNFGKIRVSTPPQARYNERANYIEARICTGGYFLS